MNEKNVEYLEKQLQMTGFSDETKAELRTKIAEEQDSFQLTEKKDYGQDKVEARLNFSRSDQGNYFFNSYDLILQKEKADQSNMHQFKVNYGNTFTLKEAYNLLDGRSVNKNFIKVDKEDSKNNKVTNAWSYMDFKNTDAKGNFMIQRKFGFDLEAALNKLPLKNGQNAQVMENLVGSLNKGNRQYVVLEIEGKEEKRYLEAAPKYGNINIYNEQMVRQYASVAKDRSPQQTEGQEKNVSVDQKQGKKEQQDEEGPAGKKKQRTGRSRKVV
ncbi:hypothetical protein [Sphingobacterium sp. MYb388]|uniref:hypothetical protein n=1 Tax=Sphingobacterium sp. MYb388 TaxID=2745437 RepID=UPI00309AC364